MSITASMVKELRERTGVGMRECKKAIVEADCDMGAAAETLRKSGQAKAAKKAGRTAAEGVILVNASADGKNAVIVEVNCETDFVAKDENFLSFANAVAERALSGGAADVAELMNQPLHEGEETTIEQAREALVVKIGENMNVRRFERVATGGSVASYRHGDRIGVLVDLEGDDDELGRDIAMPIAASRPAIRRAAGMSLEQVKQWAKSAVASTGPSGRSRRAARVFPAWPVKVTAVMVTVTGTAVMVTVMVTAATMARPRSIVMTLPAPMTPMRAGN